MIRKTTLRETERQKREKERKGEREIERRAENSYGCCHRYIMLSDSYE